MCIDTDGDGLSDHQEVSIRYNQPDPTLADTDDDGLDDLQESLFGTNHQLQDTDGDGIFDGDEVENGTDPLAVENRP